MASNTCRMAPDRLEALRAKWVELDKEFKGAKTALYAAKDRDDLFTTLMGSDMFEEASDEAEEYGIFMQEAKRKFETVRMTVESIHSDDEGTEIVTDIMNRWTPYKELYKMLNRNYCVAYSFRKKRIKEEEAKAKEEEAKERLTIEEMRLNNEKEISIKKLELEHGSTISGGDSGLSVTSTHISWSSPLPPASSQLSKKDISEFKLKNSLSAELTYLEMQDW